MFAPGPGAERAPDPGGILSLKSLKYICSASAVCFMLEVQLARYAFRFAAASAGSSIAARIAMIAITTSSSINVNPRVFLEFKIIGDSAAHDRRLWLGCIFGIS